MSGPLIAHLLKRIGRGSEITGLVVICGFGGVLGGASVCVLQGLARWVQEKWANSLRECEYIADAGPAD